MITFGSSSKSHSIGRVVVGDPSIVIVGDPSVIVVVGDPSIVVVVGDPSIVVVDDPGIAVGDPGVVVVGDPSIVVASGSGIVVVGDPGIVVAGGPGVVIRVGRVLLLVCLVFAIILILAVIVCAGLVFAAVFLATGRVVLRVAGRVVLCVPVLSFGLLVMLSFASWSPSWSFSSSFPFLSSLSSFVLDWLSLSLFWLLLLWLSSPQ